MKKNKISFETHFWAAYEIDNPFEVVDAFFNYAGLDYYKQTLSEAVFYINKRQVYKKSIQEKSLFSILAFALLLKLVFACNIKVKNGKLRSNHLSAGQCSNWLP